MNTICNLSSMFEIVVEKNTDAPFHETLKQVVKETKRLKELFLEPISRSSMKCCFESALNRCTVILFKTDPKRRTKTVHHLYFPISG